MAYNLPPPDGGPDGGPGFGGGFPGLGFPGFGKSFSLDYGAGFGVPGIGGLGGGFPGGGWAPYVPVTPLGGLWGFKGDLIVPIVAIGFAIFIFILIVLAVKYALAWKLEVLEGLAGAKGQKFLRGAPAAHLEDIHLNDLTQTVTAAIDSEGPNVKNASSVPAVSSKADTTAAPSVFGKFKKSIYMEQ
jgi:hypothetical protein